MADGFSFGKVVGCLAGAVERREYCGEVRQCVRQGAVWLTLVGPADAPPLLYGLGEVWCRLGGPVEHPIGIAEVVVHAGEIVSTGWMDLGRPEANGDSVFEDRC